MVNIKLPVGNVEDLSTSLTAGSVVFSDGSTLAEDNANLFFNNAQNFFGVGTNSPGATLDVKSNSAGHAIVITNSTGQTFFASGTADSGDTVVWNEQGHDIDFRIEGDTEVNLLFVDASTDRIGIGTNSPATDLDVNGTTTTNDLTIDNANTAGSILFSNGTNVTQDNANFFWDNSSKFMSIGFKSPDHPLHLYRGTGDTILKIGSGLTNIGDTLDIGFGNDSSKDFVKFGTIIEGVGDMGFYVSTTTNNGVTLTERMRWTHDGDILIGGAPASSADIKFSADGSAVFNEQGNDADFRIQSQSNTHIFFVDAGNNKIGINIADPDAMLQIRTSGTGEEGLNITGTASQTAPLFTMTDSSDNIFFTSGDGLAASEVVWNEQGADIDFRIEGDTQVNLLFVDASTDRIGIKNSGPGGTLDITADDTTTNGLNITADSITTGSALNIISDSSSTGSRNVVTIKNDNTAAIKTTVMELIQDAAANALIITQNADAKAFDVLVDSLTTGTGFVISADAITSGNVGSYESTSALITSGRILSTNYEISTSTLSNKTGDMNRFNSNRNYTGTGTVSDDYDSVLIARSSIMSTGAGTLNSAGSVLKLTNVATQTTGTLADSAIVLEIVQDTDSTGDLIKALGGATAIFNVGINGNVGINEASPDAMLEIATDATTEEGLHIKGTANQTASLFHISDSSDVDFVNFGDGLAGSEIVFNDNLANIDFRVEGDADANLFFTDASTDRVGIGNNAPIEKFDLDGTMAYENAFTFTLDADASTDAVTFPTAFQAAPIVVCTPPYQTSFWVTSITTTGFTFNVGTTNGYNQTINCIAIANS